jgi:hypothetical protein
MVVVLHKLYTKNTILFEIFCKVSSKPIQLSGLISSEETDGDAETTKNCGHIPVKYAQQW